MLMHDVIEALQSLAPLELAEEWDNVGLLVGWAGGSVRRVMTALDVTDITLQEAIQEKADLIVSHHPLPFRPLKVVTDVDTTGRLICKALQHGISIYSPHTAWDNAKGGINDQLAQIVELASIEPLVPHEGNVDVQVGTARVGNYDSPITTAQLGARLSAAIPDSRIQVNGAVREVIRRLAICCGSGGSMVGKAAAVGADALLTGEATYHQALEARSAGLVLVTMGHHASEAFSMKVMVDRLTVKLPKLDRVWVSLTDRPCL